MSSALIGLADALVAQFRTWEPTPDARSAAERLPEILRDLKEVTEILERETKPFPQYVGVASEVARLLSASTPATSGQRAATAAATCSTTADWGRQFVLELVKITNGLEGVVSGKGTKNHYSIGYLLEEYLLNRVKAFRMTIAFFNQQKLSGHEARLQAMLDRPFLERGARQR